MIYEQRVSNENNIFREFFLRKKYSKIWSNTCWPAGIGPDLGVLLSQKKLSKNIIFIADPLLIYQSADKLNKKIDINVMHNTSSKTYSIKNLINLLPVKLNVKNKPGMMNYKNSGYVINSIRLASLMELITYPEFL